ncbi:MAG: hypothetical protein A2252_00235 [Elusimicrobia bacterium RIFOXYA2_FULL_39_19]|nr:MAG: hypothetical protein A2252_00235 [Elusimicrobia bacterium RIFOXYA2_FULL_39_19]
MKKRIFIITFFAFVKVSAFFAAAGSSSGLTLIQPVCARAASMGDAFTAVADDINAVYYNPAGLIRYDRREFSTTYIKGVLDFSYYSAGFHASYKNKYAFAGNFTAFSAGEAEIYNIDGSINNVKALEDSVYTAALAKNLGGGFSAGINIKYLSSVIAEEFKNEACPFDAGILYRKNTPGKRISFGLCLQNMGANLKSPLAGDEGEKLPQINRAGVSYTSKKYGKNVTVSADALQFSEDPAFKMHFGVEYAFAGKFSLRAGYKTGYDLSSMSAGFGIYTNDILIDFGTSMMGVLGYTYNVSLSFKLKPAINR